MRKLIVSALAISTVISESAIASPDVVVLPEFKTEQACSSVSNELLKDFISNADLGEEMKIISSRSLEEITTLVVPHKAIYSNPKYRLQHNKAGLAALKKYCANNVNAAPQNDHNATLRELGNNKVNDDFRDIIIIGSPVVVPTSGQWSMAPNLTVSDHHLSVTRADSPYGTLGEETLLNGDRIHFASIDNDWQYTERFKIEVERTLYFMVEKRGGQFATFTTGLQSALERINSGAKYRLSVSPLTQTDQKLYMVVHGPKDGIFKPLFKDQTSPNPASREQIAGAKNVRIGISWQGAIDLDLYVTPRPDTEPLSYKNFSSPHGRLVKDYTSAPAKHGFEIVVLNGRIDLEKMKLLVNFYSGNAPEGVNGQLRISIGTQTYEAPFKIEATSGNRSVGGDTSLKNGSPANNAWVEIDPLHVVGLR